MLRRCPICAVETEEILCPTDQIGTLLVDAPEADASSVVEGQIIGDRYRIGKRIGRGGYGAVFSARHTGTGQEVAIKCLSHSADSEVRLRRFFLEARVTAGLRHPNTIRVFDFGQDESGLLYITMERLIGQTLRDSIKSRLREGPPFTQREIVQIGIDITKSLGEAHAVGLVHRDLKPDNVFLHQVEGNDTVVKVLDFGVVRMQDSTLTLGSDSGVPGTPAYMSPEQASQSSSVDGRSDLYALGIILYQLVSGTVPFRGETAMETLYLHAEADPPPLAERARVPVSPGLVDLIHACLAKSPDDRPESPTSLRDRLEAVLDTTADLVPRTGAAPLGRRESPPAARLPTLWVVLALLLGAGVGGAILLALAPRTPAEPPIEVKVPATTPPAVAAPPPPPAPSPPPQKSQPPPSQPPKRPKRTPRRDDGVLGRKI